ncbi:uncharacterized protein LOC125177932 [Hyalella azteca]|uniref:Uncharacterized protein LOC125177932 n=1 Tax=Hyalella azteca TaxID=294128 RepID=A0A979FJ81_HYAAZ|nr:uncharacterized protein LOC125177932 [Hyalella azteca]
MMAALYIVKEIEEEGKSFTSCIPAHSSEPTEQMVNVILFSMQILKNNYTLTEETAEYIASQFPMCYEQNVFFVGSILKAVANDEAFVRGLKKNLDTAKLPAVLSFECMPIITKFIQQKIMSSDVSITFNAPEDNFQNALRELNAVGCTPTLVLNTSWDDIKSFIKFLKAGKNGLQARFIFFFGLSISMAAVEELVRAWDWKEPLKFGGSLDCSATQAYLLVHRALMFENIEKVCYSSPSGSELESFFENLKRHGLEIEQLSPTDDLWITVHKKPSSSSEINLFPRPRSAALRVRRTGIISVGDVFPEHRGCETRTLSWIA